MIDVLVVDDSMVAGELVAHVLSQDPEIRVIGKAKNGMEAIEFLKERKPHVVIMDLHMPEMDGFEAARRIVETSPLPVVIVSGSLGKQEIAGTFRALEAGALAVLERPQGIGHPDYEKTAKELVLTVKLMSEVKVVRRWPRFRLEKKKPQTAARVAKDLRIVVMGASTGGPLAIQTILSRLSNDFSLPVLIVQHISRGFLDGFVEWLNQSSKILVSIARQGEEPLPGHAYVGPDGFQMKIEQDAKIKLVPEEPRNGHLPSVSFLFCSAAEAFGPKGIGVLLTGMGSDGAEGLKLMKDSGAVTIAQDQESSVVYGMPGEAMKLGAASYSLSPEAIADALNGLARKEK